MTAWLDNHDLAEAECRRGWEYEDLVVEALREGGLDVEAPPKAWRRDVSERHAYVNEVDMWVNGLRVSVKSRRVRFTSPDDVPSNRNPLFVDTVRKWELKDPVPAAVVCVSQETRACIWTPTSDAALWGVRDAFDVTRGYSDTFFTADKSLWKPLDTLVAQAHSVWDGVWQAGDAVFGVRGNRVVAEATLDASAVGRTWHTYAKSLPERPVKVKSWSSSI